jgi:hypothetical protein
LKCRLFDEHIQEYTTSLFAGIADIIIGNWSAAFPYLNSLDFIV